jgi:threonine dehydratase
VIELAAVEAARERIRGIAVRTPLIRLHAQDAPAEIYLKLETLQPIGSFKIRGAANAVLSATERDRAAGLVTASAGNMAQGVAWMAGALGVPATIAVPDHAPEAKLAAIRRLGGAILKLPYDAWWNAIVTSRVNGVDGLFIHPVSDPAVMAGNGTIGLEILEDLPDPDAVVIPYGGGGLSAGIASVIRAVRPRTRIVTAEPDTGAALAAAKAAGAPVDVDYQASFVDGAGSRRVLDTMWPLVAALVDEALAIPLADAAMAVRTLAERARVIAEGAGALAPAAALTGRAGTSAAGRPSRVVCVVSGGNINLATLAGILQGGAGLPPGERLSDLSR